MTAILIAALVLLALLAWAVWANGAPVLTRYGVADDEIPEAFDGFKIAQISDLHNAVFGEGNSKLLKILAGAEPDIIVITGDLIDSRHTDTGAALSFVRAAAELAPVYYVTGNHESRMDFGSIEPELEAAGAVLLILGSHAQKFFLCQHVFALAVLRVVGYAALDCLHLSGICVIPAL